MFPGRNFQKLPIWTLKFAKSAISSAKNRLFLLAFWPNFALDDPFHYILIWQCFQKLKFAIWNFEKCEEIVTFKMPKKAKISQKMARNLREIAKNWQNLKIAVNFAKIACDFCKNLIANIPSKIAELAIDRGVWQHWLSDESLAWSGARCLSRFQRPFRISSTKAKWLFSAKIGQKPLGSRRQRWGKLRNF